MKIFKIHYTIGDYEDEIVVEGETIDEVREVSKRELDKRGVSAENPENNVWSEEL